MNYLEKKAFSFEKEIRKNTKKIQRKNVEGLSVGLTTLIPVGILSSTFNERIANKISEAATVLDISESDVRIKLNVRYYSHDTILIFYKCMKETTKEYNERIKKKVDIKMVVEKGKVKKKRLVEEAKVKKEKRVKEEERKKAIAAIKLLGDDIYEVFKEMNKF